LRNDGQRGGDCSCLNVLRTGGWFGRGAAAGSQDERKSGEQRDFQVVFHKKLSF
jgi:hypothetical protein